ncbi:cell division protein FtsI [Thermotomaculum hydrothermale]|uniref:Cell division protein FtsI n=1 Tax=Thermotomaculum hydrothermale TaxID=981385 RepID=A0A7R6SYI0_9BACT|nr:penicillin-binding transpeptidase domain-containing protein [Thermotomaculum hydrothermale]BBB32804.1 cell division protein FtsI [Thermotomaculum hydrothermale]
MERWITIRTKNVAYAKRKKFFIVSGILCSLYIVIFLSMFLKANTKKVFAYSDTGKQKEVLKAIRGTIYDRNMDIIAGNFYVAKVSIRRDVLEKIGYNNYSKILKLFGKKIRKREFNRLVKSNHFTVKVAEIPYHQFFEENYLEKIRKRLNKLKLGDVLIYDYEYKRYYSTDEFYPKFLAYMYRDEEGLKKIGLERSFDDILKGQDGFRTYFFDRRVGLYKEVRPVDGKSLILTIDSSVQFICEKIAKKTLKKHKADNVYVIVSKPKTGEILSLVSISRKYGNMNSLIIRGAYEPGSTMKPIVGSLALDLGAVRETDTFFCENGMLRIKRRVIKDHKKFGNLSFREILWHSSNVGISKIAMKVKDDDFYNGLKMFGFGMRTGIPFYKESRGLFPTRKEFTLQRKISMSFGYGIGVTAVQMITALNAVINGGYYISPLIVKEICEPSTSILKASVKSQTISQQKRWKVIDESTSSVMRQILKGVVEKGTGRKASIDGISIGGKTGTSKKLIRGKYSNNYIASFFGFFPVDNPAISIYVVVDNPKGKYFYGGDVAAPVFREIVEKIYPFLIEEISSEEIPLPEKNRPLLASKVDESDNDPLKIKGLSFREAMQLLSLKGCDCVFEGHGYVVGYKKIGKNFYKLYGNM